MINGKNVHTITPKHVNDTQNSLIYTLIPENTQNNVTLICYDSKSVSPNILKNACLIIIITKNI